jgi:hypothetical protein
MEHTAEGAADLFARAESREFRSIECATCPSLEVVPSLEQLVWRGNKQYAHQLTRVLARLQPPFIFRSWDRSCSTICVDTRVRLHL